MTDELDRDLAQLAVRYAGADADAPLGWDKVQAFERQHAIVLPEPYRSFVAIVRAGGKECGPPSYGLLAPDDVHHDWPDLGPLQLGKPFPLTEAWTWEDDPARPDGVTPDHVYTHGVLPLGTDGDGEFWVLVATGAHRGHVWSIADVGAQPFGREFGYTTGESGFLGWVAHWYSGADWWDAAPPTAGG